MAMMPIGEKVGAQLARAKKLPVIVIACIIIGAMATVAEPDLQVLARQTPAVPDMVLILTVAAGVGALPGTGIPSLPLRLEPFPISFWSATSFSSSWPSIFQVIFLL
ncbi:MAG: DUF1538 family protein [Enterocloster clostridioformis]